MMELFGGEIMNLMTLALSSKNGPQTKFTYTNRSALENTGL